MTADASPPLRDAHDRAADAAPTPPATPLRWFLDPYVQIVIGALLVTASELLMKKGADAVEHAAGNVGIFGVAALASGWTWLGIISYVLSFVSWVHVLRFLPLGIAYALINVVHVLIPIGSWVFLGEQISARRWIGISIVVLGLYLVARPLARLEENL